MQCPSVERTFRNLLYVCGRGRRRCTDPTSNADRFPSVGNAHRAFRGKNVCKCSLFCRPISITILKFYKDLRRSSDTRKMKYLRISLQTAPKYNMTSGLFLCFVLPFSRRGCMPYQCLTPQSQNSCFLNSLYMSRIIFQKNCASLFFEWQICLQEEVSDSPQLSHLPFLSASA